MDGILGHFSKHKTIIIVEDRFYWLSVEKDVARVVSHCGVCLVTNGRKHNIG